MLKKAGLIFFVSLVYCFTANAQQGIRYNMISRSAIDIIVTSKDSAEFYRIIFPPDTIDKKWFLINDYYKSGKPKMVGKTSNDNPGKISLQGMNISYFPNGETKAEKNYENGKQIGEIDKYFPNGKLYLVGNSDKEGKLTITECRDSTGKILVKGGNGYCVEYDDDFRRIIAEGNIVNGVQEGEWHGHLKDSARYVCLYEKGTLKKGTGYDKMGKEFPFVDAQQEPKFEGGDEAFLHFLVKNIHYPQVAKDKNIQGVVFITFVVEKDGALNNVRVISGVGGGCSEEAIRVIELSSPWSPCLQYGIPMRVQYTMPISFALEVVDE